MANIQGEQEALARLSDEDIARTLEWMRARVRMLEDEQDRRAEIHMKDDFPFCDGCIPGSEYSVPAEE